MSKTGPTPKSTKILYTTETLEPPNMEAETVKMIKKSREYMKKATARFKAIMGKIEQYEKNNKCGNSRHLLLTTRISRAGITVLDLYADEIPFTEKQRQPETIKALLSPFSKIFARASKLGMTKNTTKDEARINYGSSPKRFNRVVDRVEEWQNANSIKLVFSQTDASNEEEKGSIPPPTKKIRMK